MKTVVTVVFAFGGMFLLTPGFAVAGSWYVVCDTTSSSVVVTEGVNEDAYRVMAGPLPGRRTAKIWLSENCPGSRCDIEGRCSQGPPATADSAAGWVTGEERPGTAGNDGGGGWVAGELRSKTLGAPTGDTAEPAGVKDPADPGGSAGPDGAGGDTLRPLIDNAQAAVAACRFHAALLAADHMLNFDPEHPWLAANHQRLRDLARRQRSTEDLIWQASTALSSGDLKQARSLAWAADDTAVSCQSRAVSDLIRGIDTAIEQQRQMRAAKNSAAVAALLPGLLDLANAAINARNGTVPPTPVSLGGTAASAPAGSTLTVTTPDPCAFKYEYRNIWSTEPVCTCPGYTFAPRSFRCVRP